MAEYINVYVYITYIYKCIHDYMYESIYIYIFFSIQYGIVQ